MAAVAHQQGEPAMVEKSSTYSTVALVQRNGRPPRLRTITSATMASVMKARLAAAATARP